MTTGISFQQFNRIAPHVIRSRKPIMGHGRHGVGKSEIVYQLADKLALILGDKFTNEWGKDYIFPIVERRASQMADTGDVIGVPEPEVSQFGRVTNFAPMAWFAQACSQPCILFFDEVDRANNDVGQAIMELTDSRKIAGHYLHPDTIVVAMVNGGSYDEGNSYQVRELDPAEYDRWWHVTLEPSVEDWTTWAQGNVNPVIVEFITHNKEHLEFKGEPEPNKVYPSRRSWAHFSKCIDLCESDLLSSDEKGKVSMDLYYIGEGYVGQEAAIKFRDFVEKYDAQVTVKDIFEGKRQEIVSAFGINESNGMIDKISTSDLFKEPAKLSSEEIQNVANFVVSISPELAMKAWESLCRANGDVIAEMWSINISPKGEDNKTFGNYIAGIVGNNDGDKSEEI